MTRLTLLYTLFFCLYFTSSQAKPIYVSPSGSDTNSGVKSAPVYSLTAARDLVRQLPAGSDTVTVLIAGGDYIMSEPLVLDESDTRPIVFRSQTHHRPIFRGGISISDGWQPWERGIWRTKVPESVHFEQFYVNDKRATRARTPNKLWNMVLDSRETVLDKGFDRTPAYAVQRIKVNPQELDQLKSLTSSELQQATTLLYHKWDVTRKPIDHVVADSGYLFFSGKGMKPWNALVRGSRYVLENFLGALDTAGEWYLSPDGWLYYMPLLDENMNTAECYAPQLSQLVVIRGSEEKPVRNKTFQNISFRTSSYIMPLKGNDPQQAASSVSAAIEVDLGTEIIFRDCEISQTGGYALWLRRECFDNRIERCLIQDLGAGGIKIGEDIIRDNGRTVTARNVVDNNIIRHGDYVFPCGVGVGIFHAAYNRITHNDISDLRYSGISVGWKWGYNDSVIKSVGLDKDGKQQVTETSAPSVAVGNIVSDNRIHHVGWAELSDMGAVYTLGESPGTVVSNNVIHDVYSYDYGGWGLYTDEGSTGILMENNLVYRCKSGGFHQHYGRENVIRNNIFALSYVYQLQFTRVEDHKSLDFMNNIVLMDRGTMLEGSWQGANIDMDRNCYWDLRGDTVLFGKLTIGEWQKHKDKNSIVADPMFRDPISGDFTFRSKRTARRIGFEPFDYSKAGVYGSDEWITQAKLPEAIIESFDDAVTARKKQQNRL